MILLNILKSAFDVYRNSFYVSVLGSFFVLALTFGVYLFLFPILVNLPIEEFSTLAVHKPEELQKILETADFQVKFNLFVLLINCILAPMSAGFYKAFENARNGQQTPMSVLFSFYNSAYTMRIMGYVIGLTIFKLLLSLTLKNIGLAPVAFYVSLLLSLLFTLSIPFIIFENQSVGQAMKSSSKAVAPQMFTAMMALLVGGLMALLGLLFFVVGVAVTLPFFYAVNYGIYINAKSITN